jgi:DNA-binding SARP family transcriptional activator
MDSMFRNPASAVGSALRVEVLQHFRVTSEGSAVELGRSGERLVAYLALEDRSHNRDQVAGTLWPEARQSQAAASLRRALSIVRRAIPGLVRCEAKRLSLAEGVGVDARAQRGLIHAITMRGQQTADGQELELLRRDLLPEWDELWLSAARQELRLLRLLSIEAIASAQLAEHRPSCALVIALLAVRDEPLRESAHRLVIQAHLAQGNLAEAAHQYLRYRALLWDDLGLFPSPGMEELVHPIKGEAFSERMPVSDPTVIAHHRSVFAPGRVPRSAARRGSDLGTRRMVGQ